MQTEKDQLRGEMKRLRLALTEQEKNESDQAIAKALDLYVAEHDCRYIHVFIPLAGECNLLPLYEKWLKEKRVLIAPKTLEKRELEHRILQSTNALEKGKFGTLHPEKAQIYNGPYHLILVPGLAFDLNGYRLGYGAGYYDQFLAMHKKVAKIGIAYPFQVVFQVPHEKHDQKVDGICGLSLWEISL